MHETAISYDVAAALTGSTVLVTGGDGLIGSRITGRLRALGAHVLAVGKLDAYPPNVYTNLFGIDPADPNVIVGDVADAALMRQHLARADYVVHAAALADVAACTRNPLAAIAANITTTQVVLAQTARLPGSIRRLCFASSASVYGDGEPRAAGMRRFAEAGPPSPLSVYANTKLWAEHQTRLVLGAAGVSYVIARYFSVYGQPQTIKAGSHSWAVAWLAMRAKLGLPLVLNGGGRQVRDFIHVDDVAEATVRALVAPGAHDQVINVGTGIATRIRAVAEMVGRRYPSTRLADAPMPAGDPLGGCADTTRMRAALEWEPAISLSEGVEKYLAWLEATPQAIPGWLRSAARQPA